MSSDLVARGRFDHCGARPTALPEANQRECLRTRTTFGAFRATLGGDRSFGRGLESLRRVAEDVRGGVVAECGHRIPGEQPDVPSDGLLRVFGEEGA